MADNDLGRLLSIAMLFDAGDVCNEHECPSCETFRQLWWDTFGRLNHDARLNIYRVAYDSGVALPPLPRERQTI